jgi:hypothetical protein
MKNRTTEASGHIALRSRWPRAKPALARGRLRPQKLNRPKYRYVAISTDPPPLHPRKTSSKFKSPAITAAKMAARRSTPARDRPGRRSRCGQERRAPSGLIGIRASLGYVERPA